MSAHGVTKGFGQFRCHLPPGTYQPLKRARTENRRTLAILVCYSASDNLPLIQPARSAVRASKPRLVPDTPAAQSHEQNRHPVVVAVRLVRIAHDAAPRGGHGPVDLPVFRQFLEKLRHELLDRGHLDVALHGDHGGNARAGEQRAQGAQRARSRFAVGARALTRRQYHQPRLLAHTPDAFDEPRGLDGILAVLQPEHRSHIVPNQTSVTDQVKNVVALAKLVENVLRGSRNRTRGRRGQSGKRKARVAETTLRPQLFVRFVDLRQSLTGLPGLIARSRCEGWHRRSGSRLSCFRLQTQFELAIAGKRIVSPLNRGLPLLSRKHSQRSA